LNRITTGKGKSQKKSCSRTYRVATNPKRKGEEGPQLKGERCLKGSVKVPAVELYRVQTCTQ